MEEIQPEFIIQTNETRWQKTPRPGISEKVLWKDPETGASMALIRVDKGIGMPQHKHTTANQFIFCLSGSYRYSDSGILLKEESFYFNQRGHVHGPTVAEEESVFLEIFDQFPDVS